MEWRTLDGCTILAPGCDCDSDVLDIVEPPFASRDDLLTLSGHVPRETLTVLSWTFVILAVLSSPMMDHASSVPWNFNVSE